MARQGGGNRWDRDIYTSSDEEVEMAPRKTRGLGELVRARATVSMKAKLDAGTDPNDPSEFYQGMAPLYLAAKALPIMDLRDIRCTMPQSWTCKALLASGARARWVAVRST